MAPPIQTPSALPSSALGMLGLLAIVFGAAAASSACSSDAQNFTVVVEEPPERRCATCHMHDYRNAHPVHVNVKPKTCDVCHSQTSWHPSVVHHDTWPLDGKHEKAKCFDCHTGTPPLFRGTPRACAPCHEKDLARENAKDTWHQHFPKTCQECHQTSGWKPAKSEPGFDPAEESDPAPTPAASATATHAASPKPVTKPVKATPQPPKPTSKPSANGIPSTAAATATAAPSAPPDVVSRPSRRTKSPR